MRRLRQDPRFKEKFPDVLAEEKEAEEALDREWQERRTRSSSSSSSAAAAPSLTVRLKTGGPQEED
jgi:hypothetical protein